MKKFLRIVIRVCGGLLVIGLVAYGILYAVYNEPLPDGQPGRAADALAEKLLQAINNETYEKTRYLEWSFAKGAHSYKWDKSMGKVQVDWDQYRVKLNLNTPSKSEVFENDMIVIGADKAALIATATGYFNNDSFWLVAPFKVFDEGTRRGIVLLEDGSTGLLVSYTSGGTTPGDSYLWKLGPNGFPESFQMWVNVIPIGGLEASWDDWKIMENGLALPASHTFGPMTIDMGMVRAYN